MMLWGRRFVSAALATLVALFALMAPELSAQQLRGTVRDSASRAPIPSAVIVLLDATGGTVRRTITNEQGQFATPLSPLVQRIQVLRLGFRPRTIDLPPTGQPVAVAMVRIPTLLEQVKVADNSPCPKRTDRAQALGLWEQARVGLLATVVARETHPAFVQRLDYYRIVGEERPTALSQLVHADSAFATRPYAATRSAEEFVRDGFREVGGETDTFFAPDADVMLEPAFATGYCFHLAPPDSQFPHHVGLAFRPARTKIDRVDIEGTLWVDSTARSLTELKFQYLGLRNNEATPTPGGHVSFRTMPNELLLIDHWSLQVVAARASLRTEELAVSTSSGARALDTLKRTELHETGGELVMASWGDANDWHATLGTARGRLLSKEQPMPNQPVHLIGTDYRTVTDSAGRFEMKDLVPGRYHFGVPDSALNSVGRELTRAQSFTIARGATAEVDAILPTLDDFLDAKCPNIPSTKTTVVGLVRNSYGKRADRPRVTLFIEVKGKTKESSWARVYQGRAGAKGIFLSAYDGADGAWGTFTICNVGSAAHKAPNGTTVPPDPEHFKVEAELDDEIGTMDFWTAPGQKPVVALEIYLAPKKP